MSEPLTDAEIDALLAESQASQQLFWPMSALDLVRRQTAAIRQLRAERDAAHGKGVAEGVRDVTSIRCHRHYTVPKLNENEITGAECGACIGEERDRLAAQVALLRDFVMKHTCPPNPEADAALAATDPERAPETPS